MAGRLVRMLANQVLALALGVCIALYFTPRRGPLVSEMALGDEEVVAQLRNHSLLLIGGQHRAGTTLLRGGLATSDLVAAHPHEKPRRAGTRYDLHGEGVFLQDVVPRMGLDHPPLFFAKRRAGQAACAIHPGLPQWLPGSWAGCRLLEGVGSYALGPAPSPAEATASAGRRLFRQWASHWDLMRPVLLDKSPSNAVAAPLVDALWRAAGATSPARLVLMSRHPIAQIFAMEAFIDDVPLRGRLEHWVAVEKKGRAAGRRLGAHHVRLVALEHLARAPLAVVSALLQWVAGPTAQAWASSPAALQWAEGVRPRPNKVYADEYTDAVAGDAVMRGNHARMVAEFASPAMELGAYSIPSADDLPAVAEAVNGPPQRDGAWARAWLADEGGAAEEILVTAA